MTAIVRYPPKPDALTQPFWDAAKQRKLAIQRCQTCRTYYHPPVAECPRCIASRSKSELAFEPVSGKGTIYSYTIIHTTRVKGFEKAAPYPLVFVELAEQPGLLLCANMPDTKVEDIRSGAPVEVVFEDIQGGFALPEFRLAKK